LTVVDLHRLVESAKPTAVLETLAAAIEAAAREIASSDVSVSELVEPGPFVTTRRSTVDQVLADRRGEPVVWIHGTHGVGKSTLARLVAQRSPGRWLVLDLRPTDDDPKAALAAWRELMLANQTGAQVTGVVIDDLGDASFDALHTRIATFAASLMRGVGASFSPQVIRLHRRDWLRSERQRPQRCKRLTSRSRN
jgi:hypothetical protein